MLAYCSQSWAVICGPEHGESRGCFRGEVGHSEQPQREGCRELSLGPAAWSPLSSGFSVGHPGLAASVPLQPVTIWPWGCLGSLQEYFEDTLEKNEDMLGEVFSSCRLQTLLSPRRDPWPLDVQPVFDEQSAKHPR